MLQFNYNFLPAQNAAFKLVFHFLLSLSNSVPVERPKTNEKFASCKKNSQVENKIKAVEQAI